MTLTQLSDTTQEEPTAAELEAPTVYLVRGHHVGSDQCSFLRNTPCSQKLYDN